MALVVKNPTSNAGDTEDVDLIPGLERSPGGGNDNPLQYPCLENSTGRGAWGAVVHGACKESDTTEHAYIYMYIYLFRYVYISFCTNGSILYTSHLAFFPPNNVSG